MGAAFGNLLYALAHLAYGPGPMGYDQERFKNEREV